MDVADEILEDVLPVRSLKRNFAECDRSSYVSSDTKVKEGEELQQNVTPLMKRASEVHDDASALYESINDVLCGYSEGQDWLQTAFLAYFLTGKIVDYIKSHQRQRSSRERSRLFRAPKLHSTDLLDVAEHMLEILHDFYQIHCAKQNVENEVEYSDAECGDDKRVVDCVNAGKKDVVMAELEQKESGNNREQVSDKERDCFLERGLSEYAIDVILGARSLGIEGKTIRQQVTQSFSKELTKAVIEELYPSIIMEMFGL